MFTDIASSVWTLLARYLFPTSDYYQPSQYYPYGVPFRPRFRPNGTHDQPAVVIVTNPACKRDHLTNTY